MSLLASVRSCEHYFSLLFANLMLVLLGYETIARFILSAARDPLARPASEFSKSHFEFISDVRALIDASKDPLNIINLKEASQRQILLELIVKSADVSNFSKPFHVYKQWYNRIMTEFFEQGDKEREMGLTISDYMDRNSPKVAKCQVGFLMFIVKPLFNVLTDVLPAVNDLCAVSSASLHVKCQIR